MFLVKRPYNKIYRRPKPAAKPKAAVARPVIVEPADLTSEEVVEPTIVAAEIAMPAVVAGPTEVEDSAPRKATKKRASKAKKEKKEDQNMDKQKLNEVEELINLKDKDVRVVKKHDGLYERSEKERVILTEDNKMVLND